MVTRTNMFKKILMAFIVLFLVLPYFILISKINFSYNLNTSEFLFAFKNSLIQSTLSAFFVILFGFLAAMGLAEVSSPRKNIFYQIICLVPAMIPPLFVLISVFNIVRPFPFGLTGIVLIHSLIYTGLASLFIASLFQERVKELSELALLEGATPMQFIFKGVLPTIRRDLLMLFIFLFVQFFTSFSVPLIAGQNQTTLEVLIYEKIRNATSLSEAILISLLQSGFVLFLVLFYKPSQIKKSSNFKKIYLLNKNFLKYILLIPNIIILYGLLSKAVVFWAQSRDILWIGNFWEIVLTSLNISLLAGVFMFFLLNILVAIYPAKYIYKFVLSYVPLSTALLGLSVVLLDISGLIMPTYLKIVLPLGVLTLPALFRFQLANKVDALGAQVDQALLMGASSGFIYKKILFPQLRSVLFFLSGLAAFWAAGEFALTGMVLGGKETLATTVKGLMGAYRLEQATVFALLTLVVGILTFSFFNGMGYVFNKKS